MFPWTMDHWRLPVIHQRGLQRNLQRFLAARFPFRKPIALNRSDTDDLWRKGIVIGYDGGLVHDDETVLIVPWARTRIHNAVDVVDYFHGFSGVSPVACMHSDADLWSHLMIGQTGPIARAVCVIQRRFRQRRMRRVALARMAHLHSSGGINPMWANDLVLEFL